MNSATRTAFVCLVAAFAAFPVLPTAAGDGPIHDLSKDKVLYAVGYAHLDTQWRWDFVTTIDRYILDTLDQNFDRFERFPGYVFNFTGSVRYEMMKEYYPERYERLKKYIQEGRWFVSGSSVDEGDVNVVGPEAIIRHVLYGNEFFRREFGKESVDFMLPDCFGFPASLPTVWAHCGLKGFSTQKLTWGSAVGIPFTVGAWEGPDGNSIIAALDPGAYVGAIKGRVDTNAEWVKRINANGERYGVFADYHYYGVGDMGGAPRAEDIQNYLASIGNPDSQIKVYMASSDQMYKDITDQQKARLPRYKGDLLLTEHSAGTLTSQAYMKRMNRKNEILADAAERAAVAAHWLGGAAYPRDTLYAAWVRLLANQMHDILPGTSIPRAYTYSWNDELLASNLLAGVLADSVAAVTRGLDTRVAGTPLVVYNALAIEREDVVECTLSFPGGAPAAIRVFDGAGEETPSQLIARTEKSVKVIFAARMGPLSWAVFDARPSEKPFEGESSLRAERELENEHYRIRIDDSGDVASIRHKKQGDRELLRGPARLAFTYEKPRDYPAWNMDWADREKPPIGVVGGPAEVRLVEKGPVRVALEVKRESRGSVFTQLIRLSRGAAGERVEFACDIDWQSTECALKASFPLAAENPQATYNWQVGTISRANNDPKKYEVPSHEWFDLTDRSGEHGVSILEDCKFGSDKTSDHELRLTLLYTPGVRHAYRDQHSQDWGRHDIVYGLFAHSGDWRAGGSVWQGRRLNQPLRVFQTAPREGALGKRFSLASVNSRQVDIRALKLAQHSEHVIVRLQETHGAPLENVRVAFAAPILDAYEVDGQERRIADARVVDGALAFSMSPYSPRSFAVRLAPPPVSLPAPASTPVPLAFDADLASRDGDRRDGGIDAAGRSIPAEMLPASLTSSGVRFELGSTSDRERNAVACHGQTIELPAGEYDALYLLATAEDDVETGFRIGERKFRVNVPKWTGFIGQWDDRIWDREFKEIDFEGDGKVVDIKPGYIKRERVAWFATHHHTPEGNKAYQFCYLFQHAFEVPRGARALTLPDDPRIKLVAVTLVKHANAAAAPAAPLYDDFSGRAAVKFRYEYPKPPPAVFEGVTPVGVSRVDRKDSFEKLSMGPPSDADLIDVHRGEGLSLRVFARGDEFRPHAGSRAVDGAFPRLNDGVAAQNHDDTGRCVWYDGPGRFYVDLKSEREIERINAYSWHRSNRAPQYFSVWGASGAEMPPADFKPGQHGAWKLLGVVDSRKLGDGEKHGSSIVGAAENATLGRHRYLIWAIEDVGQGTFFTEVDVHAKP